MLSYTLYLGGGVMEHKEALKYLKNAQGQVNAAIKMAENERYCVDISYQVLASIALLKKANNALLKEHMKHCVTEAFEDGNGDEKINEVLELFNKMLD